MIRHKEATRTGKATETESGALRTGRWIHTLCAFVILLGWAAASAPAVGIPVGPSGCGTLSFVTLGSVVVHIGERSARNGIPIV